jgi:hypothetical protein
MDDKIISAFSKIINSDLLKSVYPMVDHIDITSLKKNPLFQGYDMQIKIYLNDPEIDKYNMYRLDFDPHYLGDHHIQNLSKYLGITIRSVGFELYSPDGELFLDWS